MILESTQSEKDKNVLARNAQTIENASFLAEMKIADLNVINSMAFVPKLSSFTIKHAASQVINALLQLDSQKEIEIVLKVSKEHLRVQCDMQRWQQVVLNMLQNALTQSAATNASSICIELYTLPFENNKDGQMII